MQQAVSLARKSAIGHGLDSTIYTDREEYVDPTSSGACYRKEVIEQVGYFDEDFDAAEDVEFNYRVGKAGFESFTSPKLVVYYYPRPNLSSLFKQMKRYGTGRFRFVTKHPEAMSVGSLAPTVLVLALFTSFLALPLISVKPFIALFGFYLLILLAFSTFISVKRGSRFLLVLPPVFATIHFGLAWGFIMEAVRKVVRRSKSRGVKESGP
jgi:GT2 family glycosyltransferase